MPVLSIKWGTNKSSFDLSNEPVTIGRGNDNNLQLRDIKISRHHCLITKTTDGYKIADLGSSNGTLVNNQKIKEIILNDNDYIQIGDIEITFSLKMGAIVSSSSTRPVTEQSAGASGPETSSDAPPSLGLPEVKEIETILISDDLPETFGEKTVQIPQIKLPLTDQYIPSEKDDALAKKNMLIPKKTSSVLPGRKRMPPRKY